MTLPVSCRNQPDDSDMRRTQIDPSVVVRPLGEAAIAEAMRRAVAKGLRRLIGALDAEMPRWTGESTAASPNSREVDHPRSVSPHTRSRRPPH